MILEHMLKAEFNKVLRISLYVAVHDLDADKLSEESFNSFWSVLQIAMDVTKERRTLLLSGSCGEAMAAPMR